MTRTRKLGTAAMLGGLNAAAALLTGLPPAQADELADLKANQQLLEQRVDQLAQAAAAPSASTADLKGSFPRSILIPGTDTSLSIGGYVNLETCYWIQGGPVNGNVQCPTVGENGQALSAPLHLHGQTFGGLTFSAPTFDPRARGNGVLQMTARESRLRVETRTPTSYGEAGTVFEFDFAGCNNLSCNNLDHVSNNNVPRLRLAYGTLGPWLAGQAFGTTDDLAANPETLDFGGPVGEWGVVRLPQLRYTGQLPWPGVTFAVAAEYPETDIWTPNGQVLSDTSAATAVAGSGVGLSSNLAVNPTKSSMPDWPAYIQITRPWGHLRFQGVLRQLKIEDGHLINKDFFGYGGGFAGDVKLFPFWPKDDLVYQFGAGQGLGRYMNSSSDVGLATNYGGCGVYIDTAGDCAPGTSLYGRTGGPTTAAAAASILVKPVTEWFGAVGYQHWWLPNVRSNLAFGIQHQDVSEQLVGLVQAATSVNKRVYTAHANVIWSPVAFIDVGLEYMHAQRKTILNIAGVEDEVEGQFKVKF